MSGLSGCHALVTGGGRGIGRAAAAAFIAEGARVTLLARTRQQLDDAVRELGDRATSAIVDVRDAAALADAVRDAHREQALDVLVNSAGINRPGPIHEVALADLDDVLDTNLRGTLYACRAWAEIVVPERRGGAVVNVSSQMGTVGYPGRAVYCASKHAVNGVTKALALEWAPYRIRVNAVAPTFVETPFTAPMFEDDDFRHDVMARIPLGRIARVEDVSDAIVFLASDGAEMITGHILAVDGGWTAI